LPIPCQASLNYLTSSIPKATMNAQWVKLSCTKTTS